jgi:starch phosphorylase
VGAENIFIFGMTADEAAARQANGYRPRDIVAANAELAATLEMIRSGGVQPRQVDDARMVVDRLTSDGEPFLVLADFATYCEAQDRVDALYRSPRSGAVARCSIPWAWGRSPAIAACVNTQNASGTSDR